VASSVTLAQLRLNARLYADQRPGSSTSFIWETELTGLVNAKARELYDMLVEARGSDYYATEGTIAIVAGTTRYSLPADFYQLSSVTLEWTDNDQELVFPVGSTRERNNFQNQAGSDRVWSRQSRKGYKLRASQIEFLPEPSSDVTCRLQYVPTYTAMSADGDTFDGINGWEKMLALGVAMEMRVIEKRSATDLAGLYAEQIARIETMKSERDAEAPKEVVDVRRMRGRNGLYASRFDDSFDPTFG
jgi:glycogen debranching enzyme